MARRDIIAIGGSTGSVGAARQLCAALPADFPAAVFIVVHTRGGGKSWLAEALRGGSALPVGTAVEGEAVERGRVYVAAPDHHLLVLDGVVRLGRGPRENLARPAIDPLLRSVGVGYGPRAVGVVLTGLLNDGAAGLADLKRCGGISVVQNPSDAVAPEMPLSALRSSDVDYRASLSEMPDLLKRLVAEDAGEAAGAPGDVKLDVEIALGRPVNSATVRSIGGEAVPLSCPSCGGVMSQMKDSLPLRFRCQVGHAFTAEVLAEEQEGAVDEALRVALRIIEERAILTEKMAEDARRSGRASIAALYEGRSKECRGHAETLRRAAMGMKV